MTTQEERKPWEPAEHLLPRGVLDPFCPDGHVITETQDRRWLWHIRSFLAVSGTSESHRSLTHTLNRYLGDTCEHHWHEHDASDLPCDWTSFRQCLWCNVVEPLAANSGGAAS